MEVSNIDVIYLDPAKNDGSVVRESVGNTIDAINFSIKLFFNTGANCKYKYRGNIIRIPDDLGQEQAIKALDSMIKLIDTIYNIA